MEGGHDSSPLRTAPIGRPAVPYSHHPCHVLLLGMVGRGTLTSRGGSWWQQPVHLVGLSHVHPAFLGNLLKFRALVEGAAQAGLPRSRATGIALSVLALIDGPGLGRPMAEEVGCH